MMTQARRERIWRCFWFFAAIAVAILIFCFSAQTASESNLISKGFLRQLLSLLLGRSPDQLMTRYHHYVRKAAHFTVYALLGFCITGFYHHQSRFPAIPASILSSGLYAVTDELHQAFVPGRGPQFTDVLLDTSGAVLGVFLMVLLLQIKSRCARGQYSGS